jgi:hypothetical protein
LGRRSAGHGLSRLGRFGLYLLMLSGSGPGRPGGCAMPRQPCGTTVPSGRVHLWRSGLSDGAPVFIQSILRANPPADTGPRTARTARATRATRVSAALCALAVAAGLTLGTTETAAAQPPITDTEVSTFSDSFTEPFFCGGGPYFVTASGHTVMHYTYFPETGALRFHQASHGKAISVPVDGTGPTYTANFFDSDSESIRAVRRGDVLVETDTDHFRVVARGSDGSRALVTFHAHFTVNANGETTVQFETDKLVCR